MRDQNDETLNIKEITVKTKKICMKLFFPSNNFFIEFNTNEHFKLSLFDFIL